MRLRWLFCLKMAYLYTCARLLARLSPLKPTPIQNFTRWRQSSLAKRTVTDRQTDKQTHSVDNGCCKYLSQSNNSSFVSDHQHQRTINKGTQRLHNTYFRRGQIVVYCCPHWSVSGQRGRGRWMAAVLMLKYSTLRIFVTQKRISSKI